MRLLSDSAAKVLHEFVLQPEQGHYGYAIMTSTGVPAGSLYPILSRFEDLGWLSGSLVPGTNGRPPRKVYKLNPDYHADAAHALARFTSSRNESTDGQPTPGPPTGENDGPSPSGQVDERQGAERTQP